MIELLEQITMKTKSMTKIQTKLILDWHKLQSVFNNLITV